MRRTLAVTAALGLAAAALALATGGTAHAAHAAAIAHTTAATAATCSTAQLPLPDPTCTPGAFNPAVTQATIHSTICVSGWTATVRPPTSYTNALKAQGIIDYGYADTNLRDYEEDHFIPLELGGAPRDPRNLWPEPYSGTLTAHSKDGVETKLKNAVCAGTVTLQAARSAMQTDWTTAEQVLGLG